MSVTAMNKRIGQMIRGLERERFDRHALDIALQYIHTGLFRKLALLTDNGLPDDFAQRCAEIDQDQAAQQTALERRALAQWRKT